MKDNDIDQFMTRVRGQGFNIEYHGLAHGVIRRFLISKNDKKNYIDVDVHLWENMTQDDLFTLANPFMCSVKG